MDSTGQVFLTAVAAAVILFITSLLLARIRRAEFASGLCMLLSYISTLTAFVSAVVWIWE